MVDIADATSPVVAAIAKVYEDREGAQPPRTYLGASIIGKECARALWYDFRWARREKFDGRMLRLFQTGHLAEPRFVQDLRDIGCEVLDCDPATGRQFAHADHSGHMGGHMDGKGRYIPGGGQKWHVLEFKTHSAKSFKELLAKGVALAKPQHYAQMQWYMGKEGLDRALYLAVNKDTEELYAERISFDFEYFTKLQAKAERIIFGTEPPAKIATDIHAFACKFCVHKDVCHADQVPELSCRTCVHSTAEREGNGRWSCAIAPGGRQSEIPVSFQRTGCGQHLPLPFLVTYATAVDAGAGWIEFQRKDRPEIHFCVVAEGVAPDGVRAGTPAYLSRELSALKDYRALGAPELEKYRAQFPGAEIVG